MTNTECIHCGMVNLVADDVCKGCGGNLRQPFPYPIHQPETDSGDPGAETVSSIPPFRGVGDVLGPTVNLFIKNLWLIAKIVFVVVAPFEVFKALSIGRTENDWQLAVGLFVLQLMCGVLIAPALIYALMKVMQTGDPPGVSESYRWGLSKLGKLSACAAVAWLLQTIGFALLIVPGILIMLSMFLVYPLAVLEEGSVSQILRRSRNLTNGHRWKILGALIVVILIVAVINWPISAVFQPNGPVWQFTVVAAIFNDILEQATTVLSLVTYLSICALWSKRAQ